MKSLFVKSCLVLVCVSGLVADAAAQRRSRNRNTTTNPDSTSQQQNNNTAAPSGYNPYGNIPIRTQASEGGYNDSITKKSQRIDAAFDKSAINERTPLPYEHLRWDDALYTERVWRELDLREKMNMPFRYKAEDDNGDQRFISILLKAIRSGEITAFSDDRFTTPLTPAEVAGLTAGGTPDTSAVRDPNDPNKVIEYVVTQTAFDPDAVNKIRLKEDWVFDREASRMFVRILGVAALKTIFQPDGKTERGTSVMFWVYYPDIRPLLAKYEVYNPKNMGNSRMTWEELFESRMFASYITKSTLDNPSNRLIRQIQKDPILALLEGENIKEKIFNYEQDLWSY